MKRYAVILAAVLAACGGGGGGGGDPSTPAAPSAPPIYEADNLPPASFGSAPVVMVMGDSIIARWHVEQCIPGAYNFGIGGQTTHDMAERFRADVLTPQPAPGSTLILEGGTNDVILLSNPSISDTASMAAAAQQIGMRVILVTQPPIDFAFPGGIQTTAPLNPQTNPAGILEWNDSIRQLAAQMHYGLVDLYPLFAWPNTGAPVDTMYVDGLHPTPIGYAVMCSAVLGALQQ